MRTREAHSEAQRLSRHLFLKQAVVATYANEFSYSNIQTDALHLGEIIE
jgi:hypothetical protein